MNPSERIKECIDQDRVPVRYAYSLPDEETLHRLIDFPNNGIPPYLFSVLVDFGGGKEVVFGDARRHYDMVKAIEREKGKHVIGNNVGGEKWLQIQINLKKSPVRLSNIGVVGSLDEDDVMLLLGRINPGLFAGKIEIRNFTTLDHYVYDPVSGDLQRIARAIQGDEIKPLGRVKVLPVSV